MTRKRSDSHTFEQRLHEQKLRLESDLARLPRGKPRDAVIARLEQLQTAADMYDFLMPRRTAVPAR
jgi:hypothetical protein